MPDDPSPDDPPFDAESPFDDDPSPDELTERAWEALHDEEPEEALVIGRLLAQGGHDVGLELQALALGELGRVDEALAVLRRAIEQSPTEWRPRQMLGNVLSDLGRTDEAVRAFDAALECPDVDAGAMHCNASVALARDGRHFDALQRIDGLDYPSHWLRLGVQRARLFIELERYAESLALAERLRDELTERLSEADDDDDHDDDHDDDDGHGHGHGHDHDEPSEIDSDEPGYLLGTLAVARFKATGDLDAALADARAAIDYDPINEGALWAWRELHERRSPGVGALSLIVHGLADAPDGSPGEFLQRFEVMAESPGEAVRLIGELEADAAVRDSLELDGYEPIDDLGDGRAGVYYASERQWFDPES